MRQSTLQWEEKSFSVKRGEAIQWIGGLVRISTGKAVQWRGSGHSLNRQTLKIEQLLSSSPPWKSALTWMNLGKQQLWPWVGVNLPVRDSIRVVFFWRSAIGEVSSTSSSRNAHKNKIGTSTPPLPKNPRPSPPLKRGILWAWGVFQQKEPKNARF